MRRPLSGPILSLLLATSFASAAPPTLEIPPEVRPAGQYVTLIPKTDGVSVTYVGLDGLDPVPSSLLKDPRTFLLDTRGLAKGHYKFAAVAAGSTGEQARADFAVVIGVDTAPPPKPKDPPVVDPPTKPPTTPTTALYFLIVRPDGPASPEFTRAMGDPAWAELRGKGHTVRDAGLAEAIKLEAKLPTGQKLPCVLVLEIRDGQSVQRGTPVPFPLSSDDIRKLPEVRP